MKKSRKILIWILAGGSAAAIGTFFWLRTHHWTPRSITFEGAVIRRDRDPRGEQPVGDVEVTAADTVTSAEARSGANGFFKITLGAGVWPRSIVTLHFEHPDYHPLTLSFPIGLPRAPVKPIVAELQPLSTQPAVPQPKGPPSVVNNIHIRYTTNIEMDSNVGSAAQTFEVKNQADIPCNHQFPCSPDGKWKAATGSLTLDAGTGNVFRSVRCSCIAGPCPFTRVNTSTSEAGGRIVTASALDWSNTATFLVEAEVFHDNLSSSVRESYPMIFGRTLNFTLPSTQEGVSIEAELNGTPMVFLPGPDLYLSWANCTARTSPDKSTVYQCELKPGYQF
jgi:hypothetical protein